MSDNYKNPDTDSPLTNDQAGEPKTGYCSPPQHSRWKKGQSGNKKGRPKGQGNLKSDLIMELGEVIRVTEGGKQVKMTKQRAFVKSLVARAIKGDARASGALLSFVIKHLADEQTDETIPLANDDAALLARFLERHKSTGGQP